MRHFYWQLAKRSFPLFWDTLKQGDAIAGVLTSLFGIAGLTWVLQLIPWWVPVGAFSFLFLYGLLKANFETFQQVEAARKEAQDEKERLQKRLTTHEKRAEIKRAMAQAALEGELLHNGKPTKEQAQSWANRVAVMIWDALDAGEVRLFYNDFDASVNTVAEESEEKQAIRRRLKRLHELIPEVNSLDVNPDFDVRDWIGHRPPRIKVPPLAQEAFRRAKEIQEIREAANPK